MSYLGHGDVFDFGGQQSFVGEHVTGKEFGMELVNTSAVDKVIAISPAILAGMTGAAILGKISGIDGFVTQDGKVQTPAGADLDGLDDGKAGTTGYVEAASLDSENPLDYLLNYAAFNPIRVVRMNLQSNQKDQFSEKIKQRTINPFSSTNSEMSINLRSYVGADQFQEDRTEIPLLKENKVLTLSFDSVIFVKLRANSRFQINMDMGVGFNPAHTLRKRAAIAQTNIAMNNGGSVQTKK